jgi:hypothetical protein
LFSALENHHNIDKDLGKRTGKGKSNPSTGEGWPIVPD